MPKEPTPLGIVELCSTSKVRPFPTNPRIIPAAAVEIVAKSITEFGWQQPLVVDTDYVLVVGHVRLLAAKHLHLPAVPVVVATHLTPEQVNAYRIADNRTNDYTAWDFPELVTQLDELAGNFSDVLGLADWEAISATLDQAAADQAVDEALVGYLAHEHELVVVCESEEVATQVAATLIDMDGVMDVRNKR